MEGYPYPYPWKELPGTPEEIEFLSKRIGEMSVRESYLLEGAARLQSIENAADLINLTEQLDNFSFFYGPMEDSFLGYYLATYRENIAADQIPYLNLKQWGADLREQHGGIFISGGYVEQVSPYKQIYNGRNLGSMTGESFSVKLKLASEHHPEGVWVKLPDQEISTGEPDELKIALEELLIPYSDKLNHARYCWRQRAALIISKTLRDSTTLWSILSVTAITLAMLWRNGVRACCPALRNGSARQWNWRAVPGWMRLWISPKTCAAMISYRKRNIGKTLESI